MIKVVIDSVRVSMLTVQNQPSYRIIILKDENADRYLPLWTGPCEGDAIVAKLKQMPLTRPLTYDFFTTVLQTSNIEVDKVYIRANIKEIYYADVIAKRRFLFWKRAIIFDCRPTDAMLLALYLDRPIYVSENVMAQWSMKRDQLDENTHIDAIRKPPSDVPSTPSPSQST